MYLRLGTRPALTISLRDLLLLLCSPFTIKCIYSWEHNQIPPFHYGTHYSWYSPFTIKCIYSWEQDQIPPFHYETHYSCNTLPLQLNVLTAGSTIRSRPFTTGPTTLAILSLYNYRIYSWEHDQIPPVHYGIHYSCDTLPLQINVFTAGSTIRSHHFTTGPTTLAILSLYN